MIAIIHLQRGIPSKRNSTDCVDYVPAPCTHRPSLLLIGWLGEMDGPRRNATVSAAVSLWEVR